MAHFTNYTQGYSPATLSSHASRTIHSDAAFLLPYIKPADKILDVGCGPGTITIGLAELAPQGSVIGIDLSEDVLAKAKALLLNDENSTQIRSHTIRGSLTFLTVDLLKGLPFEDDTFDIVFSSQLFPHLPPPDLPLRALSEMRRVLRPGGILATRDAAELHFYPRSYDLDALLTARLCRVLCHSSSAEDPSDNAVMRPDPDMPGPGMPELFHKTGFDPRQIKVGAGTTVWSTAEERRWYMQIWKDRLAEGDENRNSWLRAGVTVDEMEDTKAALASWAADENAWYVAVQCEMLGWK